jgi:serine/threonine-protein kinase RsbW
VIHLYLNLSDPGTAEYCKRFEELGFFFAGMLPGGCGADALILQYLNNIALDYDRIKLQSALGRDLLAYIKSRDPARM